MSRQLGPTIEGFAEAARHHDGLSLVICVQGADAPLLADLRRRVAGAVTPAEADKTISILGGDGATGLYASADFFLCADAAPGLPLPLLDAMLAGMLPVATTNARIRSCLPQEAAVPISTGRTTLNGNDEPIARFLPLTADPPTATAIRDAVLAAALDDAARFRMVEIGQEAAERRFGLAAFEAGFSQLGAFIVLATP